MDTRILDLDRSLKGLIGSICWGVTYNRLTNLSLQFGKPRIRVIHEPVPNISVPLPRSNIPIEEIQRRANRRQIAVEGRWALWIYYGNWRIVRSGLCLATTSSSMRKITPALLDLQGQRLVRADVSLKTGASRFTFDLDTVLEVKRRDCCTTKELWLLYGVDGYERSLWSDGTFERERLNGSGNEHKENNSGAGSAGE